MKPRKARVHRQERSVVLMSRHWLTAIGCGTYRLTPAVAVVVCCLLLSIFGPGKAFSRARQNGEPGKWPRLQRELRNLDTVAPARSLHRQLSTLAQVIVPLPQSATSTPETAVITGYVSCKGVALPGVTLTAEHLVTRRHYVTVSDEKGRYSILIAATGTYVVSAELDGFTGNTRQIEIKGRFKSVRLDLSLHIGSVESAPPATQMVSQAATAHGPPATGTSVSISGQSARQTTSELLTIFPSQVVVVSGKPVRAGEPKDSSPLMLGTSHRRLFHGRFSYSGENSAFDAKPYALRDSGMATRDYSSHDYSISFGGPIAFSRSGASNARTSFFITYSGSRAGSSFTKLAVVPTEEERNGDFSATGGPDAAHPVQIYDPLTGQPFSQNRIPSTRLSPVASTLLQYFPLPSLPGPGPNYYRVDTYEGNFNSFSLAVRRVLSGKHRLSWLIGYHNGRSELENAFPKLGGGNEYRSWKTNLVHTYTKGTFTSSMQFQANRFSGEIGNEITEDVAAGLGIAGVSHDSFDTGIPAIALSHYSGLNGTSPRLRADRNYQASEVLTWTNGQHTLRWGGGFRRAEVDVRSSDSAQGAYVFTGYATAAYDQGAILAGSGWDFADFLLGMPQRATVRYFPGMFSFAANSWHAFINEDWRVTDRVTLNIGVRYENASPFHEMHDRMANLDIAPDFSAVVPVTAGQIGPFSGYLPPTIIRTDSNNVAPRIGMGFRIADRTVLRASYGVHYDTTVFPDLAQELALQAPFAVSQTALGSRQHILNVVDALPAGAADAVVNTFATKRDLHQGYAQVWLLELERELPGGLALGLSYTGTKGTHLAMLRAPNRTINGLRLANVAPFLWQTDEGSSILHGGTIYLEKKFGMGFWFSSSYMFSRAIDNLPTAGGVPQDEQNARAERGLSDFDERHRWKLSYSYELPLGKGKSWLRDGIDATIFGNWSWTGALSATSGNPISPTILGDVENLSRGIDGSLRPNLTGAPIYLRQPTTTEYFNTAAFSLPDPGRYGNAGRNIISGPGTLVVDMAAKKHIPLEGGHAIEVSIEATNVLNRPQWAAIGTVVNSPSFGQVTAVAPMRRVQLRIGYNF